jgi:hypothetical protein
MGPPVLLSNGTPGRASGAWVYVGTRVGFDNAHQVKGQKGKATDHRHRHRSVKP